MTLFGHGRTSPRQAAEWFARLRSGQLSPADDRVWDEWMNARPDNTQAYENVELAWELSEELRERPLIKSLLLEASRPNGGSAAPMKVGLLGRRPAWQAGVALAAALLIGIAIFIVNRPTTSEYATAVGEQRTVTLADNSTLSLNTATQVRVRYSRSLRSIELMGGEAVFSVTPDVKRPFEVHALRGTTTALGTQFDVKISGTTTAVSVLEGSVAVRPTENAETGEATKISAGEAVEYAAGTTSAIHGADANKVRGWLAQRIVFSNVTLADALADYNRYIKTPIVLGDPDLGSRRINGVFRMGDETAFLNALEQGLRLTATPTESGTVLQPR